MAEIRPLTAEETISALDQRAKQAEGGDMFRMRIQRRMATGAPATVFALFEEAQVTHFATPETWLPRLVGPGAGGIFDLMAYHAQNPILPVGAPIRVPIEGEQRPPNIAAVLEPGWDGPRKLSYPKAGDTLASGVGIPMQRGVGGSDPAPRQPDAASVPPAFVSSPVTGALSPLDPASVGRLAAAEEALARRQRDLDATEARMREANMKSEILGTVKSQMDSVVDLVRQSQQQQAALLARLSDPKPDNGGFKEIIVALAPIAAGIFQSVQQASLQNAQRQEALMQLVLTRPSIDPAVQAILDKLATKQDGGGMAVAQMSEAMASVMNANLQLMHTAAEMGLGGQGPAPDPPWVKALREAGKVIMTMMTSQAQVALANARREAAGGGKPAGALPPAPGAPNATAPATNGTAAQPPGTPAQPAAPAAAAPEGPAIPAIDRIEAAIRKHANPQNVALAILNNMQDESIVSAFMRADGDLGKLFQMRLGDWLAVPANASYVESLTAVITKLAQERGLIPAEGAEAAEGVEEETEDDEEEEIEEEDGEEEATQPPASA